MKSVIKHNGLVKAKSYPKLMISTESNVVILFISTGRGAVVNNLTKPGHIYYLGEYSDDWDMDNFKDFEGVLELSND